MGLQKKYLVEAVGSREAAIEHRTAIYLGGATIAESVGCHEMEALADSRL